LAKEKLLGRSIPESHNQRRRGEIYLDQQSAEESQKGMGSLMIRSRPRQICSKTDVRNHLPHGFRHRHWVSRLAKQFNHRHNGDCHVRGSVALVKCGVGIVRNRHSRGTHDRDQQQENEYVANRLHTKAFRVSCQPYLPPRPLSSEAERVRSYTRNHKGHEASKG
jgi:hypothetical protein